MFDFFISAGHSNVDPGAVANGVKEADIAVAMRNAVASRLVKAGKTVVADGQGSQNMELKEAVKFIKNARVSIEFHCNASTNSAAKGVESIGLAKDKKLCQDISKAVAATLKTVVRGEAGWIDQSQSARGKLAFVNNGGIIVELFFLTNVNELKAFNVDVVADAIVAVLLK